MADQVQLIFKVDGRQFPVDLCHKPADFGGVRVRHAWVDLRTLYRPDDHANSRSIVGYFWGLCRTWDTAGEAGVQDSYLLARLLPRSRAIGSRRILSDARFGAEWASKEHARRRADALGELEGLLAADRDPGLSPVRFRDLTAGHLELPDPDHETVVAYKSLCEELFGAARAVVAGDPERGVRLVNDRWDEATRKWGRRRGWERQKRVMDYLSYECRAAFHRCYSAFWVDAVDPLARHWGLGEADRRFLELWHLDFWTAGVDPALPFHWFHGHAFGLHPAGGLLAATAGGRAVLGRYLAAVPAGRREALGHVLRAMQHAVYVYARHRDEARLSRRPAA